MPPKNRSSAKSGLQLQRTTQAKLCGKKGATPGVVRVGSTNDIKTRKQQYQREGYSGKMFYARTKNMKKAEDRLLQYKSKPRHNQQRHSNNEEKPGYLYAIKGKKKSQ